MALENSKALIISKEIDFLKFIYMSILSIAMLAQKLDVVKVDSVHHYF